MVRRRTTVTIDAAVANLYKVSVDEFVKHRRHREELRGVVASLCESGSPVSTAAVADLNRRYASDVAALIVGSVESQSKLIRKFGDGVWIGTPRSAMQATTASVAKLKASWLAFLAGEQVIDLCCGIGGDAASLSRQHPVTVVDRDPAMVVAAMINADLDDGQIGDVTVLSLSGPVVHIDPDRREGGVRRSDADHCRPTWDQTQSLASKFDNAIIKLAPAAELGDAPERHRAWIAAGGVVREQSVLGGEMIRQNRLIAGGRSAWRLREGESPVVYQPERLAECSDWADAPGGVLVDPDRSIRAAGLTETFAGQFGLQPVGSPAGFLTGDAIDADLPRGIAAAAEVLWSGSVDDRKLRRVLRQNHWRVDAVKVRGGGEDPGVLHRRYRTIGDDPVVLWIGTAGRRRYAAVTGPIPT